MLFLLLKVESWHLLLISSHIVLVMLILYGSVLQCWVHTYNAIFLSVFITTEAMYWIFVTAIASLSVLSDIHRATSTPYINNFSCCYDEIPHKRILKKESIMVEEKSWQQKYNPVGHIVFTVMKQKNMGVGALLNSCFFLFI